jgi:hypothetical protein
MAAQTRQPIRWLAPPSEVCMETGPRSLEVLLILSSCLPVSAMTSFCSVFPASYDSSVGTATRLKAGRPRSWISVFGKSMGMFSSS